MHILMSPLELNERAASCVCRPVVLAAAAATRDRQSNHLYIMSSSFTYYSQGRKEQRQTNDDNTKLADIHLLLYLRTQRENRVLGMCY